MPIDATMLDAMLGTFRTMMKDCQEKNYQAKILTRWKLR